MEDTSNNARAIIRRWIERVLERKGWSPHKLAIEAGVSPATITRALKDEQYVTSTRTIEKIVRVSGIPAPHDIGGPAAPEGGAFREPEAVYQGARAQAPEYEASEHAAVWQLQTMALQLAGCLPGDFLTVDPDVTPQDGDIVCIQSVDPRSGEAETVFRVFDPPYFAVTRTAIPECERRPLMIDGEANRIWGTVTHVERTRHD
ncbi:MAG: hypothetical protein ACLFU3_09610 [Dichotomicrobium sp.]